MSVIFGNPADDTYLAVTLSLIGIALVLGHLRLMKHREKKDKEYLEAQNLDKWMHQFALKIMRRTNWHVEIDNNVFRISPPVKFADEPIEDSEGRRRFVNVEVDTKPILKELFFEPRDTTSAQVRVTTRDGDSRTLDDLCDQLYLQYPNYFTRLPGKDEITQ